jgi:hypothetical protein
MLILNIILNKKIKKITELIKITKIYYKRKIAYICFFENKNIIQSLFEIKTKLRLNNFFLSKITQLNIFSKKNKIKKLFYFIFDYIYLYILSLINNLNYYDSFLFNVNIVRYSCINFNRYLKLNY